MNNKDLRKFGIDCGGYNIKSLFGETNCKSSDYCLNRVKCVLTIYASWIISNQNQQKSSNIYIINIFDLINSLLSPFYNFKAFLKDFHFIMTHRQLLGYHNYDNKNDELARNVAIYQSSVYGNDSLLSDIKEERKDDITSDQEICDFATCFIEKRHDRKKEHYTRFSDKIDTLFFVDKHKSAGDSVSNEEITRLIAAQQILDSAHSFIFHSMRIDIDSLVKVNVNKGCDIDEYSKLCCDYVATELIGAIRKIRAASKRFGDSNRYSSGISKFISTNAYQNAFPDSKGEEIPKGPGESNENGKDGSQYVVCFIDGIFGELFKHGADPFSIAKFALLILAEDYDSDAFCEDYDDSGDGSNIKNYFQSCAKNEQDAALINEICDNYYRIYKNAHEQYSVGFRYFYWEFYKDNKDKANVLVEFRSGQQLVESNQGYLLCDWYIPAKYSTFKEEITNNETAPFSIKDWQQTEAKATMKLETWLETEDARKLIVGDGVPTNHKNKWKKIYDITDGAVITIYHIMSLLFYCNYTAQAYEFSATFRRIFWNETDRSLKKRHSKVAQWGRLLRECVDCWGYFMDEDDANMFYHGISKEMLFKSTSFKVFGPVSTTTGLFQNSVNIHFVF